jgi:hypothetical protein
LNSIKWNFLVSFWYFLNYTKIVSCSCERYVFSRTISWCKVTSSYPDVHVQPNITEELKLCFKIFFQPIYCTFDISFTKVTRKCECFGRIVEPWLRNQTNHQYHSEKTWNWWCEGGRNIKRTIDWLEENFETEFSNCLSWSVRLSGVF